MIYYISINFLTSTRVNNIFIIFAFKSDSSKFGSVSHLHFQVQLINDNTAICTNI